MELLSHIELATGADPRGTVIWMHGLGADGWDFVPIVRELDLPEDLPLRFIFPNAPVRPVTINNGYAMRAWYDIAMADIGRLPDEAGIRQSQAQVEAFLAREKSRGIAAGSIVLAGFSQGGRDRAAHGSAAHRGARGHPRAVDLPAARRDARPRVERRERARPGLHGARHAGPGRAPRARRILAGDARLARPRARNGTPTRCRTRCAPRRSGRYRLARGPLREPDPARLKRARLLSGPRAWRAACRARPRTSPAPSPAARPRRERRGSALQGRDRSRRERVVLGASPSISITTSPSTT